MRGGMNRSSLLGLILGAGAVAMEKAVALSAATEASNHRHTPGVTLGGYSNRHHGWSGKRKLKPRTRGQQPRRSKAQRRARAA